MGKEESPQLGRRSTRSSVSTPSTAKKSHSLPLTVNDLVNGNESLSLEDLISSFPGRRNQILELFRLLGPVNSQTFPIFVYGGSSTGKTSTVLELFRHWSRPLVYSSCITCHSSRLLFESIIDQLSLHKKDASNDYSSLKRCEKPSDFVNLLREALLSIISNLKLHTEKESTKSRRVSGSIVYLVIDNLDLVREWDNSSTILPFLFKLYDILKIPELTMIFISKASPDTYYSDTGYIEPISVYFPNYSEDDLRQIFMRNQENPKLYSSFLELVLRPFCRVTRRIDELSTAFSPLFKKYCEPLTELGVSPNEEIKRKLYSHLQPYIAPSLNDVFRIQYRNSTKVETKKSRDKMVGSQSLDGIDFHMSISAKYLLVSAFLASRNPATLDATLFDSTGGSSNRKRKRKSSVKSIEKKEISEQEILMKGPGTFPLERLLAIFQCITSVYGDYIDEEEQRNEEMTIGSNELMSDVLLQVSSLCSANFITKGASCPLEGSTRYRSTVTEDLALKVARSIKFPLAKHLF
ncbi:origin of replication complex subunit 5 [Impatiens glandulifera]|uniref:origin of replication complex subunit 5 n=1 Tax=Impatiens glandulifera TaxID=253017 RepID=UPI001FB1424C|nr:origin of replication complex subunit 5 [Impatiens glandulifera]